MHGYGITHKMGTYQIVLVEMEAGFSAHIFDTSSKCIAVLHGRNEDTTFDACLQWASANIRGEFAFTMQPIAFNQTVTAAA